MRLLLCLFLVKFSLLDALDMTAFKTQDIFHFFDNSQQEKLGNLSLMQALLKTAESQFMSCLTDLRDINFTQTEIEVCLGKNFEKVHARTEFIRMQLQAQMEVLILQLMRSTCYEQSSRSYDKIDMCQIVQNDAVDFMWRSFPFAELIQSHKDSFLGMQYAIT